MLLVIFIGFFLPFQDIDRPSATQVRKLIQSAYSADYETAATLCQGFLKQNDSLNYYFYASFLAHLWNKDFENFDESPFGEFNQLNQKTLQLSNKKSTTWQRYVYWQSEMFRASQKQRLGENLSSYFVAKEASAQLIKLSNEFPDLSDAAFSAAVFLYWKSASTLWLPFFTDDREEAFVLMETAKQGIYYERASCSLQVAYILMNQKKYSEALEVIEQVPEHDKSRFYLWARAKIYVAEKKIDLAINLLSQLYNFYSNPEHYSEFNSMDLQNRILRLCIESGQRELAVDLIKKNESLFTEKRPREDRMKKKISDFKELKKELGLL